MTTINDLIKTYEKDIEVGNYEIPLHWVIKDLKKLEENKNDL